MYDFPGFQVTFKNSDSVDVAVKANGELVDGHHVVIRYGDSKQQSKERPNSKEGNKDKPGLRQNQKRGSKDSITTAESKDGSNRRRRASGDREKKSRFNGLSVDTAAPAKERSRSREPASRSPGGNRRDSGSNLESKDGKRNTASTRDSEKDRFMKELHRLAQEKAAQEQWQQGQANGDEAPSAAPVADGAPGAIPNPFSALPADFAPAGSGADFPPGLAPPMMGVPPTHLMYYASFAASMDRDPFVFDCNFFILFSKQQI